MELGYFPEGTLLGTAENTRYTASREGLEQARLEQRVLEGVVLSCGVEHDLLVRLSPGLTGVIPRLECAWGLEEGAVREIAVLSRVGKPVSVLVQEAEDGQGRVLLSRRRAQERALEQLMRARPGDILSARVTHLEPFGAFVDLGCGVTSFLGIEQISVSRIDHPRSRFQVGQDLRVIVRGKDEAQQRLLLSHKELLGTWLENAEDFSPGETVTGFVRGVEPYGVFVELRPNLSGLAEPREGITCGQPVSVYLKSIVPQTMKIKLLIIDVLSRLEPEPLRYFVEGGHLDRWQYSPPECTGKRIETVFNQEE